MAIWGKLLGGAFGFMIGGPLGAMLGAAFGHNFDAGLKRIALDDRSNGFEPGLGPGDANRVQMVFFSATFSVMGHLAKADGHVSRDEIAWAESVMTHMDLPPELRKAAIALFNEGKEESFELDPVVVQFRSECHRRTHLFQMFLEIQIQATLADGDMAANEEAILLHVSRLLGIPEIVFRQLETLVRASMGSASGAHQSGSRQTSAPSTLSVTDAYQILGVDTGAERTDVKRAYRRLMSQHHPDKLVAKGLPEEMMKLATEKTQQIQKAYDVIKTAKGWK